METILMDTSATSCITAIEENLASWVQVFGRLEGARLNDIPGLTRSITNVPMSLFNSIMETRLTPENVEATIELVQTDARRGSVPLLWWTGPSTRPTDLPGRLVKHGFMVEEDGPGMAVELGRFNENLPLPPGISILQADEESSWKVWCQAMIAGFEIPADKVEFATTHWYHLLSLLDPMVTRAYTAWLDGTPVATSLLQLGGGAAGIYAVATLPEVRRRGIGAQVTLHALKEARSMGYTLGILQASEMGLPVYRSIGFDVYCQITSFVWRPPDE